MSSNSFCNCQLLGGWYLWQFPLRFACHIPTACRQDRRDPGFYPTLPERDFGIHPVGGLTQNLDCYKCEIVLGCFNKSHTDRIQLKTENIVSFVTMRD
jgi:hypothetical protein